MPNNYFGTGGKDTVNQSNRNDYFNIYTYGGNDVINVTLANTYVAAGAGSDKVTSKVEGFNTIELGSGNDSYVGNGFSSNTNRYDEIYGGSGKDSFTIKTNVSEYWGGGGADTMSSAGYRNILDGGSGKDTISYMAQDSDSFLRGKGVSVDLGNGFGFTGSDREEEIYNFENAQGTSFSDTLRGASDANKLWGMNGADLIDGRSGNDWLYGNNGGDDLFGGGGSDRLVGGFGKDILTGDGSNDLFIFETVKDSVTGSNRDIVADFHRNESDQIDLSDIDAIKGGGDNAFNFIGKGSFQNAGDLRFANHVLSGDVDGDGKADFEIRVNDVAKLSDGDFML